MQRETRKCLIKNLHPKLFMRAARDSSSEIPPNPSVLGRIGRYFSEGIWPAKSNGQSKQRGQKVSSCARWRNKNGRQSGRGEDVRGEKAKAASGKRRGEGANGRVRRTVTKGWT